MKTGVILARFQPIHNGHLQLIKKACDENEQVLVIIGSIDKLSKRNPIPWTIRKQLVVKTILFTKKRRLLSLLTFLMNLTTAMIGVFIFIRLLLATSTNLISQSITLMDLRPSHLGFQDSF